MEGKKFLELGIVTKMGRVQNAWPYNDIKLISCCTYNFMNETVCAKRRKIII